MVKKIAHIGVATQSIAAASEIYEALGMTIGRVEEVEDQQVRVVLIEVGESAVELLEATDPASPIARFIEKRGEGIHHIAFEVDDIEKHLELLRSRGVELIDTVSGRGVHGAAVAFIHPRGAGGVLIELCERSKGGDA